MEYVVNIIAAPVDEAQAVADSECPLDEWRGIDAPGVTPAMLAQIESTLTGAALSESLDRCEPLAWGEGGASVLRLDDALGERLVACDEPRLFPPSAPHRSITPMLAPGTRRNGVRGRGGSHSIRPRGI